MCLTKAIRNAHSGRQIDFRVGVSDCFKIKSSLASKCSHLFLHNLIFVLKYSIARYNKYYIVGSISKFFNNND